MSKDQDNPFALHYRLTTDITSPDKGVIARKGELVLLAIHPDDNGYMAKMADRDLTFYVEMTEIEEE